MNIREEIKRKINEKEEEIRKAEFQIREASAYIQGLSEALQYLPETRRTTYPTILRANSVVAKIRDTIDKAGKPLHVNEILKALGKPVNRTNRSSIAGSLSAYVRENRIFTKVAPNTFGLIQMENIDP